MALLLGIAVVVVIVGVGWWAGRGLGANDIPTKEHRDLIDVRPPTDSHGSD
jgi:hypothetical protein